MLAELLLLTAIALFSWAFYKWSTLNNGYFERNNIKHMKPTFLVGNTASMFSNKLTACEFAQSIYNAFPDEPYAYLNIEM